MAEEKDLSPFSAVPAAMMGLIAIVGVYAFIQALSIPPVGTAIVYGFVTDALTGNPIPEVRVTLDGLVRYTEWAGQYEIRDIAAGQTYLITFSREGYQPITLSVTPDAGLNEISVEMELMV